MENIFKLNNIYCDGMILQRGRENRLRGVCPEGAQISACLDGAPCAVDYENGKFFVILPAQEASTGHTVEVACGEDKSVITDVCFGDVFLLSGQSNMQLMVGEVTDISEEEIKAANYPLIREFTVEPRYLFGCQAEDVPEAKWKKAIYPEVLPFSAAGFFFARGIHEKFDIPVGLVMNAMGGSSIEAWFPEEELEQFGGAKNIAEFYPEGALDKRIERETEENTAWLNAMRRDDEAQTAASIPSDAKKYSVPGMFFDTDLDGYTGSLWFYREVELGAVPEKEGLLYLGEIYNSDRTYINGQLVGETTYCYPVRKYAVPAGVLHEGKNLIATRIVADNGTGGFVRDHFFFLDSGAERVDISGEWLYKEECRAETPAPPVLFPPLLDTGLYNASLYPLIGLEFSGMVWYQGETNAGAPERYSEKFTEMMRIWRTLLGQELPVVCVELCDYIDPAVREKDVDLSGWQEIQRQQREQPEHTERCACALAADLGQSYELHPQRKQELGERIAAQMIKLIYEDQ